MSKRTPIQWIKDWWEAFNEGLYLLSPILITLGFIIIVLFLILQKR